MLVKGFGTVLLVPHQAQMESLKLKLRNSSKSQLTGIILTLLCTPWVEDQEETLGPVTPDTVDTVTADTEILDTETLDTVDTVTADTEILDTETLGTVDTVTADTEILDIIKSQWIQR